VLPADADTERRHRLLYMESRMAEDMARLQDIIRHLEQTRQPYTAERVAELYADNIGSHLFLSFGRQLVEDLAGAGKTRTAENYRTTLNSFERFRGAGRDILLDSVSSTLMTEYET